MGDKILFRRYGTYANTWSASSVSRGGITWTFNTSYTVGQYITGDYFVVDPGAGVTVSSVSPAATGSKEDTTFRNGTMKNPGTITAYGTYFQFQGYDSGELYYSGLTADYPISMVAGDSIVSTESKAPGNYEYDILGMQDLPGEHRGAMLKRAQILTCVATVPYGDQFRPSYIGGPTHKRVYREGSINYGVLGNATAPTGGNAPNTQANYERFILNPWINDGYSSCTRAIHPSENCPGYSRYLPNCLSEMMAWTNCSNTNAVKRKVVIGICQFAIDMYEAPLVRADVFNRNGGYGGGALSACLYAGKVLGDATLLDSWFPSAEYGCYHGDTPPVETYDLVAPPDTLWSIAHTGWGNNKTIIPWTYTTPPEDENTLFSNNNPGTGSPHYRFAVEGQAVANWRSGIYASGGAWGTTVGSDLWNYGIYHYEGFVGACISLRLMGLTGARYQPFFDFVDRWVYEDWTALKAAYDTYWSDVPILDLYAGSSYDTRAGAVGQYFVNALYKQERPGL